MSNFAVPMDLPKYSAAISDVKSDFALSRLAAVVALSLADDEHIQEASDTLASLLDDAVEEVRVQVVESLAALSERGAMVNEAVIELPLQDTSINVQCVALESLHILKKNPIDEGLKASYHINESVRRSAVLLLATLDDKRAIERIQVMLDDVSPRVRQIAALQRGTGSSDVAVSILEDLVLTQDDELAQEALVALARGALPRSVDVVYNLATARFASLELRTTAAAALLHFSIENSEVTANQFLDSRWKSRRVTMLQALSNLPHSRMAGKLRDLVIRSKREEEASVALHALFQGAFQFEELRTALCSLQGNVTEKIASELDDYIQKVKVNGES